jgi:hypothetical protein
MIGLRFIRVANSHPSNCYAGSTITKFLVSYQPAMMVSGGATVNLAECSFNDALCAIGNWTSPLFAIEEAPIAQPQNTIIRLHRCEFSENTFDIQLVSYLMSTVNSDGEAVAVSDPHDDRVNVTYTFLESDSAPAKEISVNSTGRASTVPAERRGIDSTSTWFQWVQKVRFHFAPSRATSSIVPINHPPKHSWCFVAYCDVRCLCIRFVMSPASLPKDISRNR